jgi:ribonuclease HI
LEHAQQFNVGLPKLILTGAWYIWWERRQFTHGERLQPIHRSAMSIGVLAMNYWRLKRKTIDRKKEAWSNPPEGVIKINVDAAFDVDQGAGSMAAIARDFKGTFILASSKQLHFVIDSFMAEAYALREGLSLAQHIGDKNSILQCDNSHVIETMKNGRFSATSSAAIFDDCNILVLGFRSFKFEHCNREAHELARFSFHDHVDQFWDDGPPSFLLPKLMNDVTIFDYQYSASNVFP